MLTNAEVADRLLALAQLLSANNENPFKVKAYRRAAKRIRSLPESVDELVRSDADLTQYSGIGEGIAGAVRELVSTGELRKLETLRADAKPEIAALAEHPRLDPDRVLRIYKKLGIGTVAELRSRLDNGEIAAKLGARMADHVRQALIESREMLLYEADDLTPRMGEFLVKKCGAVRAQLTGECRRRVEVVGQISFVVNSPDFPGLVETLRRYGGHADLISATDSSALLKLASGTTLAVNAADQRFWGVSLIATTGSEAHLRKLHHAGLDLEKFANSDASYQTEKAVYNAAGLSYIEPELREGNDEVERAASGKLPRLVRLSDMRGDLHSHTVASDGVNTIEQMAAAAQERGYEYIGISDHSQSLKIAKGLSEERLWDQNGAIDKLNGRLRGIRILKSAEVDILADGSLDYPDELLRELDYAVCSIHSRFGLNRGEQTVRVLRAMDNRHFTILGHATGRLLLKRSGYELDIDRIIDHAKQSGCFFEINSSPDRLDLSAANARLAREAGVKIAVSTDAHSTSELDLIKYGLDQARRAGCDKESVLNCLSLTQLLRVCRR